MSWFTRVKDWVEEEVLTGADLNAEFDAVAAALNALIASSGWVTASKDASLGSSFGLIPGCEKAVTVTQSSTIFVFGSITFDGGGPRQFGRVTIDNTGAVGDCRNMTGHEVTVPVLVKMEVEAGTHEISMQAHAEGASGGNVLASGTSFIYLVVAR